MKTLLKYIFLFVALFSGNRLFAQNAHFVDHGVIEFEKRSNMYAIIKKKINKDNETYYLPAFEQYKKTNPQFKVSKSTLSFSKNKSLYKWAPSEETISNMWLARDAFADLKNTIATNFDEQTSLSQKSVYEELYLVKDSLRKINWKITDETREIAGYDCRRANALIMDSIYVVAYFTNQIEVSGGPESFTGLPGMILGLALPHENMTWFATKVSEVAVPEKDLIPPAKGKPTTNKGLSAIITAALKNWGPEALSEVKVFMF
ncbi:GLPGLI family protein [Pedobacter aquatilis]|uniref:GLPGLI family protein n=1 Tax=Pedobacter aquatilis TaxID=351343 RepID=UPI0029318200|nr:GLPGLI family protein [Pedobacter aquatilis]